MYLNIQGLSSHKTQLSWVANKYKPIIICLAETHVTSDYTQTEIDIAGYNAVYTCSKSARTGGSIIYIKENLRYKEIEKTEINMNLWISGIETTIEKQKYSLYSLYHSPSSSDADFLGILDEFLDNMRLDTICIILGDFNIDLASDNFYSNKMKDLISKHGLYQLIDECTRITKNSSTKIDLLITNNKNIKFSVHPTPKITDHSMISVDLKEQGMETIIKKIIRNYKNMDTVAYQLKLMDMTWQTNCYDVNILSNTLTENLTLALDEFAPEHEVTIKTKWGNKMWWNDEINNEIRERDILYKKAMRTKADQDWESFKQKRNRVVAFIRTTKVNYYNEKVDEIKNNPKEMWKTLKTMLNNKISKGTKNEILFDGKLVTGSKISDFFNGFFLNSISDIVDNIVQSKTPEESIADIHTDCRLEKFCRLEMSQMRKIVNSMKNKESNTDGVTVGILKAAFESIGDKILNLINCSMDTGTFPMNWKTNVVIPIEKRNNTIRCEEFRPINLVPPYEKLLELCVNEQILEYIETNNILSEFQAGFRAKNSCESALQSVLFNWKEALDDGKMIGVVFLDFKRAFETINRHLLLLKMERYGFGQPILNWFREYLNDRYQVTKYGNISDARKTEHGVPQGTVLGPTLFILYINDIVKAIKKCDVQLFADDTLVYVTGDRMDDILKLLNEDLNNLLQWLNNNSLQINTNKTKMMIIKSKHNKSQESSASVKISNEIIERVNRFKYLGCVIDENLTFSDHAKYISNKTAKKINVLGRVSHSLSYWTRMTIYKSIIAPHFYFCSTLLFLVNKSEVDALQRKQNKALRIVLGCNRYTSGNTLLDTTNLLSVKQVITLNTMVFIYKMVHELLPKHLLDRCKFVRDMHGYDTRSRNNFYIDRVSTTFCQNNLFYRGLKIYNELPTVIKSCDSLPSFKNKCKKYIREHIGV